MFGERTQNVEENGIANAVVASKIREQRSVEARMVGQVAVATVSTTMRMEKKLVRKINNHKTVSSSMRQQAHARTHQLIHVPESNTWTKPLLGKSTTTEKATNTKNLVPLNLAPQIKNLSAKVDRLLPACVKTVASCRVLFVAQSFLLCRSVVLTMMLMCHTGILLFSACCSSCRYYRYCVAVCRSR